MKDRRFNGKKFQYIFSRKTHRDAKSEAKALRQRGYFVRIVGNSFNGYVIYARAK